MLVLLSKSNADITMHPIIANFLFMLPFLSHLVRRKKCPPKKKKGKIFVFGDLAIVLNTQFYAFMETVRNRMSKNDLLW